MEVTEVLLRRHITSGSTGAQQRSVIVLPVTLLSDGRRQKLFFRLINVVGEDPECTPGRVSVTL